MWDALVGQDRARGALEAAARRPTHAYLVVGPPGSGAEEAARGLAAALIGGATDARTADLVRRGIHPDVVEFEPGGVSYRVKEDVRDGIIAEAHRAPVEAEQKVLIVHEAERLRGNRNESANTMLKTLEEPPPRTVLVLVTGLPDDLLPTIRSRCRRIDLDPVDDTTLRSVLEAEGVDPERAALAAALAGGRLARARALAGARGRLRDTFVTCTARIDGTGATAAALAAEAEAAVSETADETASRHRAELATFDAEMERAGYRERESQRLRTRLRQRQEREARRLRTDLLLEGVTALESVYRDALATGAPARNADRAPLAIGRAAAAGALDACRAARDAFAVNEKGVLRLEHLFLSLPVPVPHAPG